MCDYELPKKGDDYVILESLNSQTYKIIHIIRIDRRDPIFRRSSSNFTIGISRKNDIQLMNINISKLHAVITVANGQFYLNDCGSKYGTFSYFKEPFCIEEKTELQL